VPADRDQRLLARSERLAKVFQIMYYLRSKGASSMLRSPTPILIAAFLTAGLIASRPAAGQG
jgi:hypothetical protein